MEGVNVMHQAPPKQVVNGMHFTAHHKEEILWPEKRYSIRYSPSDKTCSRARGRSLHHCPVSRTDRLTRCSCAETELTSNSLCHERSDVTLCFQTVPRAPHKVSLQYRAGRLWEARAGRLWEAQGGVRWVDAGEQGGRRGALKCVQAVCHVIPVQITKYRWSLDRQTCCFG